MWGEPSAVEGPIKRLASVLDLARDGSSSGGKKEMVEDVLATHFPLDGISVPKKRRCSSADSVIGKPSMVTKRTAAGVGRRLPVNPEPAQSL